MRDEEFILSHRAFSMYKIQPPADELLADLRWLKALATTLVRDQSTADDLAQETWLAAVRNPPRAGERRPWLRQTLRNMARMRHRRESRRGIVERTAQEGAGRGLAASAHSVVEEAELRSELLKELLRLAEPYRTALLLRYFRGWEPSRIAAEMGLPAATVRSHVHRGLAKLRERLDRHHGSRHAWVLAWTPWLDRPGPTTSLGLGWLGVGAVAVVITGAWWLLRDAPSPSEPDRLANTEVVDARTPEPVAEMEVQREARATERVSTADTTEMVRGRVFDIETGEPLAAWLSFGFFEEGRGASRLDVPVDPLTGSFALPRGHRTQLMAHAEGYLPGGAILDVADVASELSIGLERDTLTRVDELLLVDADGAPVDEAQLFLVRGRPAAHPVFRHSAPLDARFFQSSAEARLRELFGSLESSLVLDDGHWHTTVGLGDGRHRLWWLDPGRYWVWVRLPGGVERRLADLTLPMGEKEPRRLELPVLTQVEGRVPGGAGGTLRVLQHDAAFSHQRVRATLILKDDECFAFSGLPPGVLLSFVVCRGQQRVQLAASVMLDEGEVRLLPEVEFGAAPEPSSWLAEGVVRDLLSGRSLAGVEVRDAASGAGRTLTDDSGRFALEASIAETPWPLIDVDDTPLHRLSLSAEEYHPVTVTRPADQGPVDLLLLPDDDARLLASGAFTRVRITAPPGQVLPPDLVFELQRDDGGTLSDQPAYFLQRAADGGFVGLLPDPRAVQDEGRWAPGQREVALSQGVPDWSRLLPALPGVLRVVACSRDVDRTFTAEAQVRPGAETRLTLRPVELASLEVLLLAPDQLTERQAGDHRVRLIGMASDLEARVASGGGWCFDGVVPGRYRLLVESTRSGWRVRHDALWVELRAGERALQEVPVRDERLVALGFVDPDGRPAWSPPSVTALPGMTLADAQWLPHQWVWRTTRGAHEVVDAATGGAIGLAGPPRRPPVQWLPDNVPFLGLDVPVELELRLRPEAFDGGGGPAVEWVVAVAEDSELTLVLEGVGSHSLTAGGPSRVEVPVLGQR